MTTQKGSAHVFIIIGLVVLLVGALGFIFWQNFVQEGPAVEDDNSSSATTRGSESAETKKTSEEPYILQKAIDDIANVIAAKGCGGVGAEGAELSFEQVSNEGSFKYVGGKSFINEGLTHAYVQYGCGSQGSVALLRNVDQTWNLLSDDARIYPMCSKVRGHEFPATIVDRCYLSNEATDPEAI